MAGGEAARVCALVLGWAVFSTWTDTLSKSILQQFPYPISLTLVHFGVSALCGYVVLPMLQLHPYQPGSELIGWKKVWPLTLTQLLGFLLTNVSFGRSAVSFTQTVKSSMPLFTLAISVLVYKQKYPLDVYLSLIPIIAGVSLTAHTDLSFDMTGFLSAIGSNICFASRTIASKNVMKTLDDINLYYYISLTAFIMLLPIWIYTDGLVFVSVITSSKTGVVSAFLSEVTGFLTSNLPKQLLLCGLFHFSYNQISYITLSHVSSVTHSILNVVRRIFVIVFTVVYFGVPLSPLSKFAIALVFAGVGWYMYAESEAKKAVKKD